MVAELSAPHISPPWTATQRQQMIRKDQGSHFFCHVAYSYDCKLSSGRNRPVGLEGKNWKALREKQKLGHARWEPTKRLTWHQIEHLRYLRRTQPDEWTKSKLAQYFGISLPAVSRILRSKFIGSDEIKARQDTKANQQIQERRTKFLEKLKERERNSNENIQ